MAKSRSTISRIFLFAGILGVPVFFIVLFSLGKPSYSTIPYFGEHQIENSDTTNYTVKEFSFLDKDGNTINQDSFQDKYLIVSILYKSCPFDCPMPYEQFTYFMMDRIIKKKDGKFSDVQFLTHVVDAQPNELAELYKNLNLSEDEMMLVSGEHNAIYDVNLLLKNPWQIADEKNGYDRGAYGLILLLDKERHIRGVYQANQTSEIKRVENELVLIKREVDKEWYKK